MDIHFHPAPEWSLWVGSFGKLFVWIAVGFFVISHFSWLVEPKKPVLRKIAAWSFTAGCLSLFATFVSLGILFANNRFEFEYVWSHADSKNTLPYRIAGIWSGQQGSFLLWGVASAVFGLLAVRSTGNFRRWFTIPYAGFLGGIAAILAYESPFNLNLLDGKPMVPPDGVGLAPSLQNYWVTIHPPTIFLGFGSLTVLFAFAIAAMVMKDWVNWVPKVRPWAILSATITGVGLVMGGFWAYETLGWGGFWAWDPVENTSFVPWLLAVALIHGLLVQTNRGKWFASNLLFGALPFLAFLYGTFLTRSGFLGETSVHSFAQMNRTALWILMGMGGVSIIATLGLWFRSLKLIKAQQNEAPELKGLHREGMYRWGNFVLTFFAIATAFGMSLPLLAGIFKGKLRVATESDYHMILSWPFFPLMLLIAAAPFVSWRGTGFKALSAKLYGSFCITIGLLGTIMLIISRTSVREMLDLSPRIPFFFGMVHVPLLPWMMTLVGFCLFAIVANTWRMVEMLKRSKTSAPAFLSHLGIATALAGLIVSRGFERKEQFFVQEGTPAQAMGYTISYNRTTGDLMDRNNEVVFDMKGPDGEFQVTPGLYYIRNNDGGNSVMAWPHIRRQPFHDIYFTVGGLELNASDVLTLKPGETARFDRLDVKFVKMTREGEPGQPGTQFGALLEVGAGPHKFQINPKMELSSAGPIQRPDQIGNDYFMTMQGMDAATGAVRLQLHFLRPLYPVELFYKPMTILVWIGTGILTLAGFWAAWVRRRVTAAEPEPEEEVSKARKADEGYAPAPAT